MKYDKVRKTPSQLLSLTGFTPQEFEAFVPTFEYHWNEYYSRFTLKGKPRQRISYNRRSSQLPLIRDKLLFILSYLKNNPLQEYHGATYGMTQPQCNEWVHRLSDMLLKSLKTLEELPDRNHLRVKYLTRQCSDILLDGTERPVERPRDPDRQKSRYSGKKTHSVKNDLLCTPDKRILWLSKTCEGHVHDKKIMDAQPLTLPTGITLWQDTGFLGHPPENVNVKMPAKKPKGKELTDVQKEGNRKISSFRILVEHAIGGVKKCRIVKDRFRCRKFGFDDLVMLIACGLHNFRVTMSLCLKHI